MHLGWNVASRDLGHWATGMKSCVREEEEEVMPTLPCDRIF